MNCTASLNGKARAATLMLIGGDFLLIYQLTATKVVFTRLGTHAELFEYHRDCRHLEFQGQCLVAGYADKLQADAMRMPIPIKLPMNNMMQASHWTKKPGSRFWVALP